MRFLQEKKISKLLKLKTLLVQFFLLICLCDYSWAFSRLDAVPVHQEITKNALNNTSDIIGLFPLFEATLSGGSIITFTDEALDEIVEANLATDDNQADKKRHFDDEALVSGSEYLIDLKNDLIAKLTADSSQRNGSEGSEARELLGRALHAIQDYYSHTTWVELDPGGTLIDGRLGRVTIPANDNAQVINLCADDLSTYDSGTGVLTSGFTGLDGGDLCENKQSSGQKCAHGNPLHPLFPSLGDCKGINKDHPLRPSFVDARDRAIDATRDYAVQILAELTGNDAAIRLLMQGEEESMKLDPIQSFDVALIEGQGSEALAGLRQQYVIENQGTALFNYTVSKAANWVTVSRDSGTLEPEQSFPVSLFVNANALSLPAGTHTDTVTFSNGITTLERQVQLTISNEGLVVSNMGGVLIAGNTGALSGKFRTISLQNTSAAPVQWDGAKAQLQNWFDILPASGSLEPGQSIDVSLQLNSQANALPVGTVLDETVFTNLNTGVGTTSVPLQVIAKALGSGGNCRLVMHFDGPVGVELAAGDIIDSSGNNRVPVNVRGVLLAAGGPPGFGTYAAKSLNGFGDVVYSPGFDLAPGISLDVSFKGLDGNPFIIGSTNTGIINSWAFNQGRANVPPEDQMRYRYSPVSRTSGRVSVRSLLGSANLQSGWHDYRYTLQDNFIRMYFDGQLIGSLYVEDIRRPHNSFFQILPSPSYRDIPGGIDELVVKTGGVVETGESYRVPSQEVGCDL